MLTATSDNVAAASMASLPFMISLPLCLVRWIVCVKRGFRSAREPGEAGGVRHVLVLDEPPELVLGPRAVDGVAPQRRRLLRGARVEEVGVAHLLHLVAVERVALGVGVEAVNLGGRPPEDAVADGALGVRPAVLRPVRDVR